MEFIYFHSNNINFNELIFVNVEEFLNKKF